MSVSEPDSKAGTFSYSILIFKFLNKWYCLGSGSGKSFFFMIRNFFHVAWRNVWKHKTYAGINILGLSLGVACGIFIFSLVTWHFSFDAFHPDKDRIYRIVTEFHDEIGDYSPGVPSPVGRTFRKDFDYAEQVARVVSYGEALITVKSGGDQKKFEEGDGVAYTEPAYFNIFDFPLLRGNGRVQ